MNRIEALLTKIYPIKKQLEIKEITELTGEGNTSMLSLLKSNKGNISYSHNKKEKPFTNKQNLDDSRENHPNFKIKEKNKFQTEKFPEQNISNNTSINKDFSHVNNPKKNYTNITVSAFNPNLPKYGQQPLLESNHNKSNNNNNNYSSNTTSNNINLLALDNREVTIQEAKKFFRDERNEEEQKKKEAEKNNINQQKNKSSKNDSDISDIDNDDDSDFYDDDNEILDKKKKSNKNEQINNNNLALYKKESLIDINQTFNIFDKSKLINVEDDFLNNEDNFYEKSESHDNNNNNSNNFVYEELKNNLLSKDAQNEKEKENEIKKKDENKEKNMNDDKENINNDFNFNNESLNVSPSNSRRFRIPIDEEEPLNDINEEKTKNNNTMSENKDSIISINIKKKETVTGHPVKKNAFKSKSCLNHDTKNLELKNNSKINKKIIMDDEDEENYDTNNKNNTNGLFLSPPNKKEKKTEDKISSRKESLISNEGSKFTVFLDNDTTSKKVPLSSKVQREKNRSNSSNNNNYNENYDLLCINSIHKILLQIEEKLKKENSEKKINERCYQIINSIKNNKTDLNKRKKNTYLGILKISDLLFSLLSGSKTCQNYSNEMCQILNSIQKYYKNIKKYDIAINNIAYYYNKKIAFKYVYSSLELKNYDINTLKELSKKSNSEEEKNNNNMIKLIKTYKRYRKTSEYLLKKFKEFREKVYNPQNKIKTTLHLQNKYESCPSYIQTSPNFMTYMKLFNHYYIILSFFNDYKVFKEDLERMEKEKKIDTRKEKEKTTQINKNGIDVKAKNRERSRYKENEKEKDKERKIK